jgi:hypothetical protein
MEYNDEDKIQKLIGLISLCNCHLQKYLESYSHG